MRQVLIYPGEDGYWVAECPSPLGCISQGQSRQDAIANIKEAIDGYLSFTGRHFDDLTVRQVAGATEPARHEGVIRHRARHHVSCRIADL